MYGISLTVLIFLGLLAVGFFFSPIFALVILVLALLAIGAVKFLTLGPRPESSAPPSATTAAREDEDTGLWGEKWPEQRTAEEEEARR